MGIIIGGAVGGIFGGLSALIEGKSVLVGVFSGAIAGAAVGAVCDAVLTGGIAPVLGVILIGVSSGAGELLSQVGNNYVENKQVITRNSSIESEKDLKNLQEKTNQSIMDVDYSEVAKSALIGIAFAPLAYGTNKIVSSAFSGLESSSINNAAKYIASGIIEFNNSAIQFVVDLF